MLFSTRVTISWNFPKLFGHKLKMEIDLMIDLAFHGLDWADTVTSCLTRHDHGEGLYDDIHYKDDVKKTDLELFPNLFSFQDEDPLSLELAEPINFADMLVSEAEHLVTDWSSSPAPDLPDWTSSHCPDTAVIPFIDITPPPPDTPDHSLYTVTNPITADSIAIYVSAVLDVDAPAPSLSPALSPTSSEYSDITDALSTSDDEPDLSYSLSADDMDYVMSSPLSAQDLDELLEGDLSHSDDASSTVSDGSLWEPELDEEDPPKSIRPRPKPYTQQKCEQLTNNASPADKKAEKKQRKKIQNKNAATRYREKKKEEAVWSKSIDKQLEDRNKELREKVDELSREIDYMKSLMAEISKARLHKKK